MPNMLMSMRRNDSMKVINVLSPKGGVGKTLVSINLARRLKEEGHTVGLFDADFDS